MKIRLYLKPILFSRLPLLIVMTFFLVAGCQVDSGTEVHEKNNNPKNARNTDSSVELDLADTAPLTLIVTNSKSDSISFIEPAERKIEQVKVGVAPFGIALATGHRAYVSTAEGIAVVDTKKRERIELIPYKADTGQPEYGEYRPGGMGIAVSPDGRKVYVGVHLSNQPGQLEVLDVEKSSITANVPVGDRPFDVVVSRDGNEIYSIDHDSYSVTVVDSKTLGPRKIDVSPFGRGAWEKPHFAALRADGRLLLPFQGRGLVILDPESGKYTINPLTGNTHQEGVALSADGKKLLIVGNGAAGSATGEPNLTVLDIDNLKELIFPLNKIHQNVAVSPDGRWAYLTGGVTFADQGWDGLTVVDLKEGTTKELEVPDYPLDIEILPQ